MNFDLNNKNDQWKLNLDIDDSDLRLTPVLRPCSSTAQKRVTIIPGPVSIVQTTYSSTRVETSTITQKPVRIIPDPVGIVQAAKLLKQTDIQDGGEGYVMSTQEYMKKVVEDVGKDKDFKSGSWVRATDYVNTNGGISCSPNVSGDLAMTLKDLSGALLGTIHHKVIDEGGYGKDITIGDALILANVSNFTPKPSMHYLNITMRNVVKVFRKDTVPGSGSGMLMEERKIEKLMEEEEMADLELQARAEQEWLEEYRQKEELDEEHEK
ncbi:hypothetical protein Tco_1125055 [Tanacetum coccineum]|uniref:Homologous recombination OB-fold protein OB-fold domain-containing protein n=1 Tax=Tanacetum coccineum TaxID=301880 RepID=A0ABQ5J7W7_9ASTR